MITPKIKALFQFIEYLNSNIENFNQYNDLINELIVIKNEQRKLNPKGNYKDKRQYEKFQKEIESKFKELQHQTADQIKTKATKLKVFSFEGGHIYSFNGIENDIQKLKDNFSKADLREILKHKRLYLEYRNSTHKTFLSLHIFFEDLDKLTKSLFDFFKDTEQNEFEQFETKAIQVNSIKGIIEGFKQGHTKFTLPTDVLFNPSHSEQPQNEALPPQQTETKTEQETPKKNIANEYALAYIFDLYANGKQIPVNRIDGGYDKKELIKKGNELYQFDKEKDTFYRAVKHVAKFDLNKQQDLANISQSWIESVKRLSNDWNSTEKYLKEKKLIGE
ncbi:MAG: hypothetical protein JST23_12465 [Bacteroidetes bacterium]|nr:hypothetical protein [Bacteroidota bacterium]